MSNSKLEKLSDKFTPSNKLRISPSYSNIENYHVSPKYLKFKWSKRLGN